MTQFTINYTSKEGEKITVNTEKNSVRSVWSHAKALTGKQFYTVTVKVA